MKEPELYGVVKCFSVLEYSSWREQLELKQGSAGKECRMSGNSLPFNES